MQKNTCSFENFGGDFRNQRKPNNNMKYYDNVNVYQQIYEKSGILEKTCVS